MLSRIEVRYRKLKRLFSRSAWLVRLLGLPASNSIDGKDYQTGLLMIQIDGLSEKELERALIHGEMPFLQKLLSSEDYHKHSLYSGLPSSTPAVQAELFYGVKGVVPAFSFIHKKSGRIERMFDSESAKRIESELQALGEPLLAGGSAYCNIYTGGASEAHFCAPSLGFDEIFKHNSVATWFLILLLNIPSVVRIIALLFIELGLAVFDLVVGLWRGYRFLPEFKFIGSRVAIGILLREFITLGATMDIARGLPVIHLNLIGYDEQAHRRGPDSGFAHWTLRGIDRAIAKLWRSSNQGEHRHYDVWIYSDHGQEATIPYAKIAGRSLQQAVEASYTRTLPTSMSRVSSPPDSMQHQRSSFLGGKSIQKLFPKINDHESMSIADCPLVVAMGPVGHVYLGKIAGESLKYSLGEDLVKNERVPAALFLDDQNEIVATTASGCMKLPAVFDAPESANENNDPWDTLLGPSHPHRIEVALDLAALCRHTDAGDIVLLGWAYGQPPISFPQENGAHAGPGPVETAAFALLPGDTPVYKQAASLRPMDLRKAAFQVLGPNLSTMIPQNIDSEQSALRVMTYNVHSCVGLDGKVAPERIARVIARYEPDVVALQELDVGRSRTRHIDQAELIAQLLEMNYQFHPAIAMENEQYGDAILSRLPMKLVHKGLLPTPEFKPSVEPRGALWVTVDVNGSSVQIINTHLGLFSAEQQGQVDELLGANWLGNECCTGPLVFCGDLNATPSSNTVRRFTRELSDVQLFNECLKPKNTFASRFQRVRIDHVMISNIGQVARVQVPDTELTRVASDHLPVIVDLVL